MRSIALMSSTLLSLGLTLQSSMAFMIRIPTQTPTATKIVNSQSFSSIRSAGIAANKALVRERAGVVTKVVLNEPAFLNTLINLAEETSYSKASYYTTLGLYALSFPGLISLITRSVKSKDVRRTFVAPGPSAKEGAKEVKIVAAEVMAYFLRQNYQVADNSGGQVVFKGVIGRSKSQAFFLTFCTFMGLISLALVLSIQFQDIGQNWFYITLLSPYAGVYYWNKASREDTVKVSLESPDEGGTTEIVAVGNKEELERMATTLNYGEKGMVRVQGIFEQPQQERV